MSTRNIGGKTWDQFSSDYDFNEYAGRPDVYLIASLGRTGSHFLSYLLFRTGQLGSPLEYLHPRHKEMWCSKLGVNDTIGQFQALFRRRTSPSGWFGIKAHWPQFATILDQSRLMELLSIKHYIRLRRRDLLDQAISFVIAQQTGAWISHQHVESKSTPKFDELAIQRALDEFANQAGRWDEYFCQNNLKPLEIYYEDMVENPESVVSTVLAEFNLPVSSERDIDVPSPRKQGTHENLDWKIRFLEGKAKKCGKP